MSPGRPLPGPPPPWARLGERGRSETWPRSSTGGRPQRGRRRPHRALGGSLCCGATSWVGKTGPNLGPMIPELRVLPQRRLRRPPGRPVGGSTGPLGGSADPLEGFPAPGGPPPTRCGAPRPPGGLRDPLGPPPTTWGLHRCGAPPTRAGPPSTLWAPPPTSYSAPPPPGGLRRPPMRLRPLRMAKFGQHVARFRPSVTKAGQHPTTLGQTCLAQFRPNSAEVGRIGPTSTQIWPKSLRTWSPSDTFDRTWPVDALRSPWNSDQAGMSKMDQ